MRYTMDRRSGDHGPLVEAGGPARPDRPHYGDRAAGGRSRIAGDSPGRKAGPRSRSGRSSHRPQAAGHQRMSMLPESARTSSSGPPPRAIHRAGKWASVRSGVAAVRIGRRRGVNECRYFRNRRAFPAADRRRGRFTGQGSGPHRPQAAGHQRMSMIPESAVTSSNDRRGGRFTGQGRRPHRPRATERQRMSMLPEPARTSTSGPPPRSLPFNSWRETVPLTVTLGAVIRPLPA